MASSVYLQGATYSDVPSIIVPASSSGGTSTFYDVSDSTLTDASDLTEGVTAYNNAGTLITGTGTSGGTSSWTHVGSTTYDVTTSSTSAATVATWATGDSSIWDSSKIIYIKIRDTAGARAGYCFGSDQFFMNYTDANGSSTSTSNGMIRITWMYTTSSAFSWRYSYSATGYGVYADQIYSNGRIRIRSRYNSSYSLTVDGTFQVDAYILDTPDGVSPFA